MSQARCALIVLDGYGYSSSKKNNAIERANAPFMKGLMQQTNATLLRAAGTAVGLPADQMGNSEVGHLHLGAGRRCQQGLLRIDEAISEKQFEKPSAFLSSLQECDKHQGSVHIIGLLSKGGVHSHERHLRYLTELVLRISNCSIILHAILDGRDTPPKSAQAEIEAWEDWRSKLGQVGNRVFLGSLSGRYYAMDRDNRWDRTQKAYELYCHGKSDRSFETAQECLNYYYDQGLSDEFIPPSRIHHPQVGPIDTQDLSIFANFRADRARQLSHAFVDTDFSAFERCFQPIPVGRFWTLTVYEDQLASYALLPEQMIEGTLGEVLAKQGKRQLRVSETEKFAHVTFFFNGNRHPPFPNEERLLIPSPKVDTYDQMPEMSSGALTEALINAIDNDRYDFILCNYPNADMVGHTGHFAQTVQAIEALDQCLAQVAERALAANVHLLITADHGNAERMYDETTQQPHTAHTDALVPFIYLGPLGQVNLRSEGGLIDVAPSVLNLLEIPIPDVMEGKNLILKPQS